MRLENINKLNSRKGMISNVKGIKEVNTLCKGVKVILSSEAKLKEVLEFPEIQDIFKEVQFL